MYDGTSGSIAHTTSKALVSTTTFPLVCVGVGRRESGSGQEGEREWAGGRVGVGRRESGSGQEGEWEWAGGRVGVGRRESGSGQEGEWEWAGGRVGVGRRESGSGQEGEWEWAGGRVGVGRRESGSGQEGEWEWAGGRVGVGRSGMTQSDTISSIAKLVYARGVNVLSRYKACIHCQDLVHCTLPQGRSDT